MKKVMLRNVKKKMPVDHNLPTVGENTTDREKRTWYQNKIIFYGFRLCLSFFFLWLFFPLFHAGKIQSDRQLINKKRTEGETEK